MGKKLKSEKKVIQAPMSFTGSAKRWWKLTGNNLIQKLIMGLPALVLILLSWVVILHWYVIFSVLLTPYRLLRRGSRKRKRDGLIHREMLDAQVERRAERAVVDVTRQDDELEIELHFYSED